MSLRRFFGLKDAGSGPAGMDAAGGGGRSDGHPVADRAADTATVRRIVAELSALPPAAGRYLAGFAYILSRAAHADLDISDEETRLMERYVVEYGGLPEAQAVLAVEIAKHQSRQHGGTEDYLVTREFRDVAAHEQRLALLRCCFAVGAADASISAEENAEIRQIATELGLDRAQLNAVAGEFKDQLSVIQAMRRGHDGTANTSGGNAPS